MKEGRLFMKKFFTVILLISALVMGATAATQIIDVPTAYTLGQNNGEVWIWTNINYFNVKAAYSPLKNLDGAISIYGHQNLFYGSAEVKWQFLEETSSAPAVALGLGNDVLFGVVSKNIGPKGLAGHAGLGAGRVAPIFAGIDYILPTSGKAPKVTLLAEINNSLNFGASVDVTPALKLLVALKGFDDFNVGGVLKFKF